jgi:hypothetical protein
MEVEKEPEDLLVPLECQETTDKARLREARWEVSEDRLVTMTR